MKYFLAVVPPTELATQIDVFRAEWGQSSLPAHITVKAPNSLSRLEQWLPEVTALCHRSSPIPVHLEGIRRFPSGTIYWQVKSPGLIALHHSVLTIIAPPIDERAAYFEGSAYVPHLTLAHLDSGSDTAFLNKVGEHAANHWRSPVDFVAETLRVFRSSGLDGAYEYYTDLPLTGKQ